MSEGTIDWALGLKVQITTLLDNTIIGTVYAFCQTTNTIALLEEPDSSEGNITNSEKAKSSPNYRIIKTSFVRDIIVLGKPKKIASPSSASIVAGTPYRDIFSKASPPISKVNVSTIPAKAYNAVQAELKNRSKIGVGVSKEAQEIFDQLSKVYGLKKLDSIIIYLLLTFIFCFIYLFFIIFRVPCVWKGKSIIAMDEVQINPPYTPESCISEDRAQAQLYIQKLVEGIQKKLFNGNIIKGG